MAVLVVIACLQLAVLSLLPDTLTSIDHDSTHLAAIIVVGAQGLAWKWVLSLVGEAFQYEMQVARNVKKGSKKFGEGFKELVSRGSEDGDGM